MNTKPDQTLTTAVKSAIERIGAPAVAKHLGLSVTRTHGIAAAVDVHVHDIERAQANLHRLAEPAHDPGVVHVANREPMPEADIRARVKTAYETIGPRETAARLGLSEDQARRLACFLEVAPGTLQHALRGLASLDAPVAKAN